MNIYTPYAGTILEGWRACKLYGYCLFYLELLSNGTKLHRKIVELWSHHPPLNQAMLCVISVIPPEAKLGYFSRFSMFLASGGKRKCHTGFLDSKLVDWKTSQAYSCTKSLHVHWFIFLWLHIWIIEDESSEVFVHDAPTRPSLSIEQLPFPSFFFQ